MALQKQYWEMIFGQSGQERKVDAKVVQPPALLELINGEIIQPGQIRKRNSYVGLESAPEDSSYGLYWGDRAERDGALVALADYKIGEAGGENDWTNDNMSLMASSEARPILSNKMFTYRNPEVAYYSGHYYLIVTEDYNGAYYSQKLVVFDANFTVVNSEKLSSTAEVMLKIIAYDSSVMIFKADTASNFLYAMKVSTSTFKVISSTAIRSDLSGTIGLLDVDTDGIYAYVVYINTANSFYIAKVNSTPVVSNTAGFGPYANAIAISVHVNEIDSTDACMIVCDTVQNTYYRRVAGLPGSLSLQTLTAIGTTINDATQLSIGTGAIADEYYFAIARPGASTPEDYVEIYCTTAPTTLLTASLGVGLAHKFAGDLADNLSGPFLGTVRETDNFGLSHTCQLRFWDSGATQIWRLEPVAKYFYRITSGIGTSPPGTSSLPRAAYLGTYEWVFPAVDIDGAVHLCSFYYSKVSLNNSRFQRRFHSSKLGDELVVGASLPLVWDGQDACELGFCHPPEIHNDTVTGAAGSIAAGTYNFIVIYTIKDNKGRTYKSQLSQPYQVVVGVANATVEIEFTFAINRPDLEIAYNYNYYMVPQAELYRTENGGTVYYKTAEFTVSTDDAWFSQDSATGLGTLVATESDANLIDNELLYTTGDVLERCAPPPLDYITNYDNRIFGIDSDTGNICYSSEIVDGEGPWFNSVQVVEKGQPEKPVALVPTPGFLLVFWKNKIGAIYGEGPNSLGVGATYTQPRIIVNTIGCIEQKSIAALPNSIIFKAASGFHVIGFDGSVPQYIGSGARDYDDEEIVDASVIHDKKQVRFVTYHPAKPILVYNYEYNQWYMWGYNSGAGNYYSIFGTWETFHGGCSIDNTHYIAINNGNTFVQDGGYLDGRIYGGAYSTRQYSMAIRTPWIKLAGLQGYKRVLRAWILGEYRSDHDLKIIVDYDYDTTSFDVIEIINSDIEANYIDPYQVKIGIKKQRCQSIRFQIVVDTTAYTAGAGAYITGLRLEYMGKEGGYRRPIMES